MKLKTCFFKKCFSTNIDITVLTCNLFFQSFQSLFILENTRSTLSLVSGSHIKVQIVSLNLII